MGGIAGKKEVSICGYLKSVYVILDTSGLIMGQEYDPINSMNNDPNLYSLQPPPITVRCNQVDILKP